jgi:MscS family membrane protein
VLVQIVKLANGLGVRFAFPTQTMHMESFPEKKSLVPEYSAESGSYQLKLQEFMNKELNRKDQNS